MAYIGKSPSGLGVRTRYYYTATGGETSLSGADDNGRVLKFTDGEYIDVYLNGVLLVAGTDYGTGTANTISSLDALSAGNIVEIVAYDIHSLAKPNLEALRKRYYKTATGGETSISGNDDDGQAITFAANAEIEVYLNGVALVQGDDYNTTTANTVGGLAALDADDIVSIVAYEEFTLGDVVSKKSGGTFASDVTFSQDISVGVNATITGDLTVDTDTLYVDSTNNRVGVGTTSPTRTFYVDGQIGASGRIHTASGSATDCGLGVGDDNTGLFRPATNTLGFSTDGTERLRITNAGSVYQATGNGYIGLDQPSGTYASGERSHVIYAGASDDYIQISARNVADNSGVFQSWVAGNRKIIFTAVGNGFWDGTGDSGSADYAEYFEWDDGNTNDEDRVGYSVVLTNGNKIRKATSSDAAADIIGVVSGRPAFVGDSAYLSWHGKWDTDDFARRNQADITVYSWTDEEGEYHEYRHDDIPDDVTIPSDATSVVRQEDAISSNYDSTQDYTPRQDRQEWNAVGMMGKLRLRAGQPTGDRWIKMRDIATDDDGNVTVEEWLVR